MLTIPLGVERGDRDPIDDLDLEGGHRVRELPTAVVLGEEGGGGSTGSRGSLATWVWVSIRFWYFQSRFETGRRYGARCWYIGTHGGKSWPTWGKLRPARLRSAPEAGAPAARDDTPGQPPILALR
jgi:hypothetical protein